MLKNLGEKIAISFKDQKVSYRNLMGKIELYASKYEINKGDRAVIFSENRPAWIYSFFSIWTKTGIPIPIDFGSTVSEVSYILKDSTPSVILTSHEGRKVIEPALKNAKINTKIILIDEYEVEDNNLVSDNHLLIEDKNETSVIIYTSGTTGQPKGVMLSYNNMLANIDAVSRIIPIFTPDSETLILLPLHHILPLLGSMIAPLYVGSSVAMSPSMQASDILDTLDKNKVSIMIGVPRLYETLHKGIIDKINSSKIAKLLFNFASKVKSKKLSKTIFGAVHKKFGGHLTYLVSGGAALNPVVGRDFQTLGFEVLEGYGMTETAPMITFTRPGRVRIGSPGELMPGVTAKIVDGEITVSGNNIMKGYYNKPEETEEVLKGDWLYTGDLGHIDEDGYLYITGRKKEIIVTSNGKNINPAEIEEELSHYAAVVEAGVFYNDDQIQAVIVTTEKITDELYTDYQIKVIEDLNNKVSSYKRIFKFYLTNEELPKTQLGKLQRYKLTDYIPSNIKKEEDSVVETNYSEEYRIIANYIKKEKSRTVKPSSHLEFDIGLDSLDKVALHSFIFQSFGINMNADAFDELNTIEKLVSFIEKEKTKIEEVEIDWNAILQEQTNFKLPNFWISNSFLMRFSKFFFKIYFRFNSKGEENIPDGPCIIAPNHQSFFDGLLVTALMRTKQIRNTFFYAKAQHVKKPFVKFIANNNNIIVVDLNKNLKESIQKLAEVLKQKKNLMIFPEGTRSANGDLGDFKKTFAILSRELNIPIVPVSISGANYAMPKGSLFPKPFKKINVEFLKPIYPKNMSYENITNTVRDKIKENLSRLKNKK